MGKELVPSLSKAQRLLVFIAVLDLELDRLLLRRFP
jgi:hypothetical protein